MVNKERISYWISKGAKPSDTVASLLKKEGMANMEKYLLPPNRKRTKKGEGAAEKKPAVAPAAEKEAAPPAPTA